jgi:gliding motility-associated-like protein
MRAVFIAYYLMLFMGASVFGQEWKRAFERPKCFIENQGQFDSYQNESSGTILFAADFGKAKVFFGKTGIRYVFLDAAKGNKATDQPASMNSLQDHKQWERNIGKYRYSHDELNVRFPSATHAVLSASNPQEAYFSYTFQASGGEVLNKTNIKGYEQLVYHNIAPGIDLSYTIHPESGLKYALIVHPKASIADFRMIFDRDVNLLNQEIHINTIFGDWIDHAPISFYEFADDATIPSSFTLLDQRTVGFNLGKYDQAQTVVIDPWTQLPSFASNWDCVWECDKDAAGNIYAIGGVMPMQLLKYNAAGALQWTYNTPYDTSNVWLGTFAVDNLGNSYVTAGSTAAIQKISPAGALVWNNANPGGLFSNDEFWSISFNCDQSMLVVGGTGGSGLNLTASIYNIDITNGNVISSADVAQGSTFGFPPSVQEVRAICASPNGKYYFMTQDTVGAFNQNFNACNGAPLFYKIDNSYDLGYKCENYRYDNAGICAIKANNSFYYTQNGVNVVKRNLQTGAILTTSSIPGGANTTALGDFSVSNSGIDIDNCGNVYVGSSTGVVKFDANLVQLATYPTTYKVYDVHVTTAGDVVAVGSTGTSSSNVRTGYIQTFAAAACAPMSSVCCDASICPVQNVCISDAPIQLTAATPGGTWSGPGVSATGLFTPANAGVGSQTITYTLACGSESTTILVSPCQGLSACLEANGSVSVFGGVAPYAWAYYQAAQNTPITNQGECQSCGYTWFFGQCLNGVVPVNSCNSPAQWVNFANGTNATPPAGVAQVQVTDAAGTVQVLTLANLLPCNPNPCPTITVSLSGISNVTCYGQNDGEAIASASGGTAPYTYTWLPGNFTGASQTNLAAGTYTITATDAMNCTGDTTLTITQPNQILVNAPNITGTQCGSSTGAIEVTVTGGSGNYSYAWNPNAGAGAYIQNLAGGSYSVVVTDQATGCSTNATYTVPSLGGPILNNPNVTNVLCAGETTGSITASAGGSTPPYQYQVNNGPFQNSGVFAFLASGQYTITAMDAAGCENSLTVTITEPASLQVSLPTTVSLCLEDSVELVSTVSGGVPGYTYAWSTGESNPSIWVQGVQNEIIFLSIIDANGCENDASVGIEIIPCGSIVYDIPNVFSPNGDGTNDQYGIFSENVISQEAIIVNRWGELMIQLNQVNQLWDGTLPSGQLAKDGVYFMKFRLVGLGGEEKEGHVFFHLVN